MRLVFAEVEPDVRASLHRYGLTDEIGEDSFFVTVDDLISEFRPSGAET